MRLWGLTTCANSISRIIVGKRAHKSKKAFIYEQRLQGKTIRIAYKNPLDLDKARAWATDQRSKFNKGNEHGKPLSKRQLKAIKRLHKRGLRKIKKSQPWHRHCID
jgi:hypothetical protein